MDDLFGIPMAAWIGQLVIGLINGSFYALMSLGLAIIFGLLHVVNFAHGAQYMVGAFVAWILLEYFGIGYWPALLITPVVVGAFGLLIERLMLRRLYGIDHVYALLLTFGLSILMEGVFRLKYGATGQPYPNPISGGLDVGVTFIPGYRLWVIVVSLVLCLTTWFVIERTKLGALVRAGTENPRLVEACGVNVPLMITLTYGFGVPLTGFAGVLAAPIT